MREEKRELCGFGGSFVNRFRDVDEEWVYGPDKLILGEDWGWILLESTWGSAEFAV